MDLDNNKKNYVKIDRETGRDEIFTLLDEINSDLEDDIDNSMNNFGTEFILAVSQENELDSNDEPMI